MTPEQARALLAAPELLAAADPTSLRVAEELRRQWPSDLVAAASEQADLRQRALRKTEDVKGLLLTRAGLEQASTRAVANHRATRFADIGGTVIDFCCGVGFDLRALASVAHAVGIDRDETHAICAANNSGAATVVADVRDVRVDAAAAVFVDPSRRDDTARGGSEPPLAWCMSLPASRVAVKTAPGVDLRAVGTGWEVEFVAEGRDLKEACLWSPGWATVARRATVLPTGESLVGSGDGRAEVRPPGAFVLDPSPAVTRAGLVAELAATVRGWQADPKIAFLYADSTTATAFGRWLRVEASMPFALKPLAAELRRLDVGSLDLRRRGLAGDVAELGRRLRPKQSPGSTQSRRATVLLTRVVNRPWAFICFELDAD